MVRRASLIVALCGVLSMAACGQKERPEDSGSDIVPLPPADAPDVEPGQAAPPVLSARAQPTGPAEPLTLSTDEQAQQAAAVTQVSWLPDIDAKIFSTAGGDPAINGLYTYLAFAPESPAEPWRVFQIGDYERWEVVEHGPGRVVLQVRQSRIDPSSGDPVTEEKKLIVEFAAGSNAVTVSPAR